MLVAKIAGCTGILRSAALQAAQTHPSVFLGGERNTRKVVSVSDYFSQGGSRLQLTLQSNIYIISK